MTLTRTKKTEATSDSWTIREIRQQPEIWEKAAANLVANRAKLSAWLSPLLARRNLRIVLTGAGSSAYIGEALAPALTERLGRPIEAISTTSIVSAPQAHLLRDIPTLLVSFGRSGNSPESLATVELADQIVDECFHIVICCNENSTLVQESVGIENRLVLAMPSQALDQSFAMTSSFSSMLVSTLALFCGIDGEQEQLLQAAQCVRRMLAEPDQEWLTVVGGGLRRVVFLGSGSLHGIATEAALKTLELSAGRSVAIAESSLGFRHGPKFIIDGDTAVIILPSPDKYIGAYDEDLIAELEKDDRADRIVRLDRLSALKDSALTPQWQGLVYLVWCQLLAYHNALILDNNPDNPSPSGEVNRVVKGVSIYPYLNRSV